MDSLRCPSPVGGQSHWLHPWRGVPKTQPSGAAHVSFLVRTFNASGEPDGPLERPSSEDAIFGWLACGVVVFAIGNFVSPMKPIVFETSGPGESGRANTIIYEDFKQPAGEGVLMQSESLTASDPEFRATVQAVIAGVSTLDAIAKVESPLRHGEQRPGLRRQEIRPRPMEIKGSSDDAADKIDPWSPASRAAKGAPRVLHRLVRREHRESSPGGFFDDLKKAGLYSIPLTLIILLVAFGALVAAGIPLLLGLTAVLARWDWSRSSARCSRCPTPWRDHPPDRARRRRRLHDVLFEAGT